MVAKKRWSLPIDARQALESGRKKVFYISTEPVNRRFSFQERMSSEVQTVIEATQKVAEAASSSLIDKTQGDHTGTWQI